MITVGTDVHPFNRLVQWSDKLAEEFPVDVLTQYGKSDAPKVAEGVQYLAHKDLIARMESAACVITHGGPASILEANTRHARPIVVPRDSSLGEHVDDHQLAFAAFIESKRGVAVVHSYERLRQEVETQLAGPPLRPLPQVGVPEGVQRFSSLMDDMISAERAKSEAKAQRARS